MFLMCTGKKIAERWPTNVRKDSLDSVKSPRSNDGWADDMKRFINDGSRNGGGGEVRCHTTSLCFSNSPRIRAICKNRARLVTWCHTL
jgi:hypothetical protein